MFRRLVVLSSAAIVAATLATHDARAAVPSSLDDRYAIASAAFRAGDANEAYGRFLELANAGHAPSIEVVIFMYEHGTALFGRDWDLAPYQLIEWAWQRHIDPARIDASLSRQ